MEPSDLLRFTVEILERLSIPYLVTGSTATITYGEPRFTQDIDIVIDLPSEAISAFCSSFPKDQFYLSEDAVKSAVLAKFQFNVLHPVSGLKLDFIVLTQSDFDRSRIQRGRKLAVLPNQEVQFASPEDVIIKKLMYFQEGGSEKHLRDISGVIRIQGVHLDFEYVKHWADQLGLNEIWESVRIASLKDDNSPKG